MLCFRNTLLVSLVFCAMGASSGEVPKPTRAFFEVNCLDCHDADTARAGFRIDLLGDDFNAGNNAGQWKEVMDKINSGEMPPKKRINRPDAKEAFPVTSWIAGRLRETELAAQGAGGRVPMRRMNRVEYANTVRDLFSLDDNFARRIEKELPADGKVGGFDRGAASLFMDEGQLERTIAVVDMLLDEAVFNEKPEVKKLTWDATKEKYVHGIGVCYKDETGTFKEDNPPPGIAGALKEPLHMIPVDGFQNWQAKERRYVPHGPFFWELKNGGIEYLSGGNNYRRPGNLRSPFNAWDWGKKGVTRDGWYRLRIKAGAFAGRGKEAQKEVRLVMEYCYGSPFEVVQSVVIDAPLDAPKEYEFRVYLQAGPPGVNRSLNIGWDNGDKDIIRVNPLYDDIQRKPDQIGNEIVKAKQNKKPEAELEALKKKLADAMDAALENRKSFSGPFYIYDPKLDIADRPRLWLGQAEWEGPLVEWPPKGRTALFFAGEERSDDGYMREIFATFLPRAYRRPVTSEELDRVVTWTLKAKAERNLSFTKAVREGVKNVLCSAKFLFLGSEEMPSAVASNAAANSTEKSTAVPIDAWQLASRLSYLLWSSTPDEELYRLAAQNTLREPAVLRAQVKRMIADPKAAEFVRSFAGQWLSVRNFDNGTPPNRDFYRLYDDALRDSSKQEPLAFFSEILKSDLPIVNFLDSDFVVVNERLAKHYGMEGVSGDLFRKVPAPVDGRRGGVLGMAGILTYLADGTRTLPVRRATWVIEALWNQPVPQPPPNAGDLPASKEKKLSVRARLDMHRKSENCASCHVRIDPFGMALENYDATGMWRDRQNGEGMSGDKSSPALDVSGTLPDGTGFKTIQDFKKSLIAQKQQFIRGFTEKLLCYALGRPIAFGDHVTVDRIMADAAKNEYRFQELIQAMVASGFFQTR